MTETSLHLGGPSQKPTALDVLKAGIKETISRDPVTVLVPERPGWKVRCHANIDDTEREKWRTASIDGQGRFDGIGYAARILANTCEALIIDGDEVTEGGVPVTFQSPSLWQWAEVSSGPDDEPAPAVVRKLFSCDPHVDDAGMKVLEGAGYGEEVQLDPTPGSSKS